MAISIKELERAFRAVWSAKTSWTGKFNPKNPSANQCRITSAVAQNLLGGKILFAIIKNGHLFPIFGTACRTVKKLILPAGSFRKVSSSRKEP